MRLILNCAAAVLLALLLASGQVNAQDQSAPSAEQPEGAQEAASSMTGEQQSAAKKAFCSALAGQYKNAATTGVSDLWDTANAGHSRSFSDKLFRRE
jgi:hypothetical protein